VPWPNTPHDGSRSLHFCIFFASQREAVGNMEIVLAIIESICQSKVMDGEVRAAMMILESPPREKDFNCKEVAREATSLVACASPKVGSQGGLTWEITLTIFPFESLHTVACTEKFSRIAVSKFTLKDLAGGGDQNFLTKGEGEFHAAA
jgi:hypothetical protein